MISWLHYFLLLALQHCVDCLEFRNNGATLITFDVDGTLVKGSGRGAEISAHARAISHAVGEVFDPHRKPVPLPAEVLRPEIYHGSTDGLIVLNLVHQTLGIDPSASLPRFNSFL